MTRIWRSLALVTALCATLVSACTPPFVKTEQGGSPQQANAAQESKAPVEQPPAQIPVSAKPPASSADLPPERSPFEGGAYPSRFPEERVTLMAVGDIMVHDQQLEAAWSPQTKSYDFHPSFVHVKPLFQEADWVIGNLETTLAGSEARYSGYPMFNSPESLATVLKEIGVTAVSTANNHSLDRKEQGVLQTIAHLDEAGILHTGTFRSAEERSQPLLLQKGNVTLALLSYTYGTNGIPIPEGKPYLVNLIDPTLIKQDIEAARNMGADLVAVALHFGEEYSRLPNEKQKQTAELCLQYGADLILGSHPHVVQPYEWKTVIREDGTEHKGLIAYSLGNFISAQRWDYKDVGAILKLTLYKGGKGEAAIESVELIPTYVYFYRKDGKRNYVIYPVPQTLEKWDRGERDPYLSQEALAYMRQLAKELPVHASQPLTKKKAS